MIRAMGTGDVEEVSELWLEANIDAHGFVGEAYWRSKLGMVSRMLPLSEVYVFDDGSGILGFIGIVDDHIEGVFVRRGHRSQGIGHTLMDHAKSLRLELDLNVYQKNVNAVDFYLGEGFSIVTEGIDEETGEPDYTMIWISDRDHSESPSES